MQTGELLKKLNRALSQGDLVVVRIYRTANGETRCKAWSLIEKMLLIRRDFGEGAE
jgi:hypothetical protein